MNCQLCSQELYRAESKQYGLCFECRHWPGQTVPKTDEQHHEAVSLVRRLIKSVIGENEQ